MTIRHPLTLGMVACALALILAGCSSAVTDSPQPVATEIAATSVPQEPTPTPQPRTLNICLGEEPNTLYPLGNPNAAALSVLAAIYDGPVDTNSFGYQPVILKKVPAVADGDAVVSAVDVKKGIMVVNTDGRVVALDKGVMVYPSACKSADCAITYDGTSPLKMDQMAVTFTFLPNLKWSDGAPLTAADSVYAYDLARDWSSPNPKYLVDRTQAYEVVDDLSVQWWGVPGFIDQAYPANFFAPLPKHAWESFGVADLVTAEQATRTPLGWGAFVIDEWVSGDHITLSKNPNYFRAAQGLPLLDTLTFRFAADPNAAIAGLISGECDLLDTTVRLDGNVGLLRDMQASSQAKLYSAATNVLERLDFGISPAAYDDGYTPGAGDRPAFFNDKRTRQALAMCLDRQTVIDNIFFGLTSAPDAYIPAEHPLFNADVPSYPYDPARAAQLLDQAGWLDQDNNPQTPRIAINVPGVPVGTPFTITYATTEATQRRQVSELFAKNLTDCGIGVTVSATPAEEFYAPGPDGSLFGRKFDLGQFAMGSVSLEPPCGWFSATQIPNAGNNWLGANVSGFGNTEYDAACLSATLSLGGDEAYRTGHKRAQYIFSDELPSLPLYWRLKIAAGRTDLCGFALDPTAATAMWNIEGLGYSGACSE